MHVLLELSLTSVSMLSRPPRTTACDNVAGGGEAQQDSRGPARSSGPTSSRILVQQGSSKVQQGPATIRAQKYWSSRGPARSSNHTSSKILAQQGPSKVQQQCPVATRAHKYDSSRGPARSSNHKSSKILVQQGSSKD